MSVSLAAQKGEGRLKSSLQYLPTYSIYSLSTFFLFFLLSTSLVIRILLVEHIYITRRWYSFEPRLHLVSEFHPTIALLGPL